MGFLLRTGCIIIILYQIDDLTLFKAFMTAIGTIGYALLTHVESFEMGYQRGLKEKTDESN